MVKVNEPLGCSPDGPLRAETPAATSSGPTPEARCWPPTVTKSRGPPAARAPGANARIPSSKAQAVPIVRLIGPPLAGRAAVVGHPRFTRVIGNTGLWVNGPDGSFGPPQPVSSIGAGFDR